MSLDHDAASTWMRECIRLAQDTAQSGNYALGALVVRHGEVIARSASALVEGHDPTAHPEIVALRAAAERVGSRYLHDAYLVSTLEPCVMCTGAAIWAKLSGIVFGASQADAIAWSQAHPDPLYTWRQIRIDCQTVVDRGEPQLEVLGGVLRTECLALFGLNQR